MHASRLPFMPPRWPLSTATVSVVISPAGKLTSALLFLVQA